MDSTGNFLIDLFGQKNFVEKANLFRNLLDEKNQIPFVHFDGENNFENQLFVIRTNGEKITFKEIYDELGYRLNRGPFFYLSNCMINYSFETFIIFVQDGWIIEDPYKEGAITLYPWDVWGDVLFTKHRDLDGPVILMANPTEDNASELSISPKIEMKSIIIDWDEKGAITKQYNDELKTFMTFGFNILKRYWTIVNENRNKSTNSIPIDMLYILNTSTIDTINNKIQ